jgi:hypothetical protein
VSDRIDDDSFQERIITNRSPAGGRWRRTADGATLGCMALGIAVMLQPWWSGGLRVGFFVTLGGTVAQIVASHLRPSAPESGAAR